MSDGIGIDMETAVSEFDRFAAAWRLDSDVDSMEEEDRQSFEGQKRKLVAELMAGRLSVTDTGELDYVAARPNIDSAATIHFNFPTGAAMVAWDKFKDRQNMGKMNAWLGSVTKQPPVVFATMDGADLKVCQAVAVLFLAS